MEPQTDFRLVEQARAIFPKIYEPGAPAHAVVELERLAKSAWSAEGTALLRHYLGYALAVRSMEVRGLIGDSGVVIVERLADRILALDTCDPELDQFAEELLGRGEEPKPRNSHRAVFAFACLLLVFGVVPVVTGGLMGSATLVGSGALLAVFLVAAFAWQYRVMNLRAPVGRADR
ncbi:hypothetical protein [Umezawaea sp. Da 62-37]|uniref:hypothetical protein n=1 Tax=Umezawaea sp. Da 62-37 TaxID=3075927 RepID=UPI0028F71C08|nr:hypothetical protein [Umezawaea sp. Da 62-37]WNV90160.1 hypothetical protein RM788_18245 [Umezawaea sp. Da 62-37]